MRQLTQDEAERCAKCCGPEWEHEFPAMSYTQKTDPYFWMPRLWERLLGLSEAVPISLSRQYGGKIAAHISFKTFWGATECAALCAAIEHLEK